MGLEEAWTGEDVEIYLDGYDAGLRHRDKEIYRKKYRG